MKTNIGVIGQGFVGKSVSDYFKKFYDTFTYDKQIELGTCKTLYEVVASSDVIFICVPTPMKKDGSCDTSIVESVIAEIDEAMFHLHGGNGISKKTCIIKSTVPPGTTQRINNTFFNVDVIFSPEFLTEATAFSDFVNQNRIILGGDRQVCKNVKYIFNRGWPGIPIIIIESDEAEMVKYMTNTYFATKVAFANEIYQICKALDIDYDRVVEYAKLDTRLGVTHLDVPGPDGDFGFGGHCLPKDLSAIRTLANQVGVTTTVLDAVEQKNDKVRLNKNWLTMIGRAVTDE